eukprot:CAMPEP_0185703682 /NCGR_PEP_ID=MMETSP1164-20130828/15248_1 /TAXON_ID=1104430 /ORGANISM="Chrysoreinhardia sp, Strain CCMP2950" /LENGTH=216 /DNA_ID=CAMNT_0028370987 /DNA_START=73 /DNA_END=723 /DNA_ORIENTATION=-
MAAAAAASSSSKISFRYLDFGAIGGRGGVVRFFLLAHGLDFDETLYNPATEWPAVKKALVESGENPAGTMPIVTIDGAQLTQHIAIMREIAKRRGISASGDFASDAVADQYQAFRDAWVSAAFMGGDKAAFKKHVTEELQVFEGLYAKYATHDTYLAVGADGKPLWGDVALFALIRDLMLTGFVDLIALPPRLAKMVGALAADAAVAAWLASKVKT